MYSYFLDKILLPIGSYLFSGNYSGYLVKWKKYDQMSSEDLEQVQTQRISEILKYAQHSVPYYRALDLPEEPSLLDFPILTKSTLRAKRDTLISEKFKKETLEKNHSSGSSGQQSVTYMSYKHKFYIRALQTHWWKWGGYRPGERLLQAGMSLKRGFTKKTKDVFFRVDYLDAFNLSEKELQRSLDTIKNKSPKHLAGYPSALNEIALATLSQNKTLAFQSVISYGDKLFDHHVSNFNRAFQNPPIINTYGCAEGMLMACKWDLPFYYIMSPHVFLEVVDDEGNRLKDGERGHILVTCLTNYAMPLIRYKLGDLGIILPKNAYPKSRKFNYPLLKEVTGRETDVIKAPNGNVLIVHTFTGIIEYYDDIKQFKVIQTSKDSLKIEYLTDDNLEISQPTQDEILQKLLSLVENSMTITFELVESIAASPSGKPEIIEIRSVD